MAASRAAVFLSREISRARLCRSATTHHPSWGDLLALPLDPVIARTRQRPLDLLLLGELFFLLFLLGPDLRVHALLKPGQTFLKRLLGCKLLVQPLQPLS